MCGIVAIVRGPAPRRSPEPASVLAPMTAALASLERLGEVPDPAADDLARAALAAAEPLEAAGAVLVTTDAVAALLAAPDLTERVRRLSGLLDEHVERLGGCGERAKVGELDALDAALARLADAAWAISRDRLGTVSGVAGLLGRRRGAAAVEIATSVQQALSAIDRLEVRGRDSAGLAVVVQRSGLDVGDPAVADLIAERAADPLLRSMALRQAGDCVVFVYKAAAEIGELGDNTRALRSAIAGDPLLGMALEGDDAVATVLGHTRWASVGMISQPNAHPVDSVELAEPAPLGGPPAPLVLAALNGDVDNFAELRAAAALRIADEISTDAKVIPTLVARRLAEGAEPVAAFRETVASFEGSVAIAALDVTHPRRLLLAQRGSGQALYVGMASGATVVASEPYGLVECTDRYVRLDGETPADPDNPTATRGQIVVVDGGIGDGSPALSRYCYDGTALALGEADVARAGITTRDIDRGHHAHYFLKEISEAPRSVRRTLRGRLVEGPTGSLEVRIGPETLPLGVREDLRAGRIRRVQVIGQGTARIAGEALADALRQCLDDSCPLRVESLPATELSGFGMRDDMADTLVVAVSQSGTTTDTNRTVDLVRDRGARVVAVVNRRRSDLTDKVDGVLYTSDGRDVEMSVASTKAFYAQIAAGLLLGWALAAEVGGNVDPALPEALAALPEALAATVDRRAAIGEVARRLAPPKRYWAVVGNGANRIAAEELRIKLSELCYKSIACDATEDKKHIDLSSEPLVLVCAAGLSGSTADDVAKEVAIYRAHKASAVVIATDGEERFAGASATLFVPPTDPRLAFVLAAAAGHLFGYEAALAIDALALPLRAARAAVEAVVGEGLGIDAAEALEHLHPELEVASGRFSDGLRSGSYDGHLEAGTAVRLASALRYATGVAPLDGYQAEARVHRHAGGRHRRPGRCADGGDRPAHPTRGCHQAPGQDGDRGDLAQRRDPAAPGAGACRAGSGRSSGPPRLPDASHLGRPRPDGGRGDRLDPLHDRGSGTRRGRRGGAARVGGRPRRDRSGAGQPHREHGRGAGHEAHRGRRAPGVRNPRTRGRADRGHRARDQGRRDHRHHAAARGAARPGHPGRGEGCSGGLPGPVGCAARRRARDRAQLPGGSPR